MHSIGYSLNEIDGLTPLNLALKHNYKDIIEFLIQNGADIFLKDETNYELYDNLYFCIMNDNLDIFKKLEEKGFDIFKEYEQDHKGSIILNKYYRPIHIACAFSAEKIILYLITKGDSVIYTGNCKDTPLEIGKNYGITITTLNIISTDYKSLNYYVNDCKHNCSDNCPICLDDIYSKTIVKLECGHVFHRECLINNIKNSKNCPYCRGFINIKYYVNKFRYY